MTPPDERRVLHPLRIVERMFVFAGELLGTDWPEKQAFPDSARWPVSLLRARSVVGRC